jgi:YesN/AraC family two-component response regulator
VVVGGGGYGLTGMRERAELLDGIELVATAADGEEALRLAAEHDPDVVLMDLRMPRLGGITGAPAR